MRATGRLHAEPLKEEEEEKGAVPEGIGVGEAERKDRAGAG